MSDYISREAAISAAKRADDTMVRLADAERMSAAIVSEIEKIPAADVRPVVRGKWIIHKPFDSGRHNCNECIECSVCGTWFGHDCYEISNFCPSCGADMREENRMNKDINRTLMALVRILRMNGEMVKSIEAVNDWFKVGDREYMKEVAEITYDNGTRRYADIGCGSNLTAVFDVVAVIQQIKPCSSAIERIVRGVYRQYPIESIPAADD